MAKETKAIPEKKILQKEIAYQLENSLGKLKDLLGEKKFNSRINKAVKLFTEGIKTDEKKPKKGIVNPIPTNKTTKGKNDLAVKPNPPKAPVKKRPATKKSVVAKTQVVAQ
ncbi:hypothetical protein [Taibaiella koreensis]|uniref:hypothetical protein n=1 Tax=Taibaiella koreensis TaxID=1268548 RepID=UPI000E59DB1E|nr:hypothetical protein [Taibaiella koreensis]